MPSFKFDAMLVPNVLTDQGFRATGRYIGTDHPYFYVVLDPRRYNVNVWRKPNDGVFRAKESARYRKASKINGTVVASNGPPMDPPVNALYDFLPPEGRIILGWTTSAANDVPWDAWDVVRRNSATLHPGRGNVKYCFERTGQGSLAAYRIAAGTATGVEGLSGVYGIVGKSAVIPGPDLNGLKAKSGVAAWCKRPFAVPHETQYESTVPWFEEADRQLLDGVLIAVGQNGHPTKLAERIVIVGCTDAVAMDGSDSAVFVAGGKTKVDCAAKKDVVQRWGLCAVGAP